MYEKIRRILLIATVFAFLIVPIKINAQESSLNDLIENGKNFDKKQIVVKGEAIGEPLSRNNYTWININDKTSAMGIYMDNEDAKKVEDYGGYNKKGDSIKVTGQFNRACKEHGGDMDIHSNKVEIIKKGETLNNVFPKYKIFISTISSIIVLVLGYIIYKKKRK